MKHASKTRMSVGNILRILRAKKWRKLKRSPLKSFSNMEEIKYPEITKNTSTPIKPP